MKKLLLISALLGSAGFGGNAQAMYNLENDEKAKNTVPVAKKEEEEFKVPYWTPQIQFRNEKIVVAHFIGDDDSTKAPSEALSLNPSDPYPFESGHVVATFHDPSKK